MEDDKKQIRIEKIIKRLLSHSISLSMLLLSIYLTIKKNNYLFVALSIMPVIAISLIIELEILTDDEYIEEKTNIEEAKTGLEKQKAKEIKEGLTAYATYEENKQIESNEEFTIEKIVPEIEENIESDLSKIESKKKEYVSLLELVEKYKELERKQNIESSDNDSLDDIGYAYMKR